MSQTPTQQTSTRQLRKTASQHSLTHKASSGSMRYDTGNVAPRHSVNRHPSNGQIAGTNGVQFDRNGFPIVSAGTSESSSPNRAGGAPRPVACVPGPTGAPQSTIGGGGQPASAATRGTVAATIVVAAAGAGYLLKKQHDHWQREGMPQNQSLQSLHKMMRGERPGPPARRTSSPHQ